MDPLSNRGMEIYGHSLWSSVTLRWRVFLILLLSLAAMFSFFADSVLASIHVALRQPMTCDQIVDEPLRSLSPNKLTLAELNEWVEANYPVGALEGTGEKWRYEGRLAYPSLGVRYVESINVQWESAKPTVSEITNCFGTPDLYRVHYQPYRGARYAQSLELWYLDQGLVLYSIHPSNKDEPPSIDGSHLMGGMTVVKPGTVEELVRVIYDYSPSLSSTEFLQSLKPWPGSWEEIEVNVNQ